MSPKRRPTLERDIIDWKRALGLAGAAAVAALSFRLEAAPSEHHRAFFESVANNLPQDECRSALLIGLDGADARANLSWIVVEETPKADIAPSWIVTRVATDARPRPYAVRSRDELPQPLCPFGRNTVRVVSREQPIPLKPSEITAAGGWASDLSRVRDNGSGPLTLKALGY